MAGMTMRAEAQMRNSLSIMFLFGLVFEGDCSLERERVKIFYALKRRVACL